MQNILKTLQKIKTTYIPSDTQTTTVVDVYPPGTMFSTESKADRKWGLWGLSSDQDHHCIQSPKRTASSYTHKDVTEKWFYFQAPSMDIHIVQHPYGINTGWLGRTERRLSEMMEMLYYLENWSHIVYTCQNLSNCTFKICQGKWIGKINTIHGITPIPIIKTCALMHFFPKNVQKVNITEHAQHTRLRAKGFTRTSQVCISQICILSMRKPQL